MRGRIIITGGASGMGAALVRAFARDEAAVTSLDVNADGGEAIAAEARAAGGATVRFAHCDVADPQGVNAVFDDAVRAMGGLDTLIHAAAIAPGAPAEAITPDDWDRVMAINARGTFLTNQAAFRHMRERGGRIINFASAAGIEGLPGKAHYSATKGAMIAWTRTIAKEWGRYGITVNAVAPAIRTPMYEATRAAMSPEQRTLHDAEMAQRMPIDGRLGDAERDLVPLLRFLAGKGSRYMTGQIFAVDGGLLMVR